MSGAPKIVDLRTGKPPQGGADLAASVYVHISEDIMELESSKNPDMDDIAKLRRFREEIDDLDQDIWTELHVADQDSERSRILGEVISDRYSPDYCRMLDYSSLSDYYSAVLRAFRRKFENWRVTE